MRRFDRYKAKPTKHHIPTMRNRLWKLFGYVFYRPIRRFFYRMVANCYLRVIPEREIDGSWRMPNIHWWILYKTVFQVFDNCDLKWWRKFAIWKNGRFQRHTCLSLAIQTIGSATAGSVIYGGNCSHCGSAKGCQVDLSDTDEWFELVDSWSQGTMDGTDHRFFGFTECPNCLTHFPYEDGSL